MNKISVLFFGLMLGALPSVLHAQQQGSYKIDKITPNFIETPQYQVNSIAHQEPNPIGKWLEVEVQFEAAVDTPELTVKYFVYINGQLYSGDVTHVNVAKGRELYSVIYVAPGTLTSLLAGRPATPNMVSDVGVQILIKGQVVAELSTKASTPGEWWSNYQQTPGFLLNKNQTPFAPLYWDRYPQIKSSDH